MEFFFHLLKSIDYGENLKEWSIWWTSVDFNNQSDEASSSPTTSMDTGTVKQWIERKKFFLNRTWSPLMMALSELKFFSTLSSWAMSTHLVIIFALWWADLWLSRSVGQDINTVDITRKETALNWKKMQAILNDKIKLFIICESAISEPTQQKSWHISAKSSLNLEFRRITKSNFC